MSAAGAECVSAPTLITSTPAFGELASTRSSVMPPEASSRARPARTPHGLAQRLDVEVVEQDDVGAGPERLLELVERVDLDLDAAGVRRSLARRLDGCRDAAGRHDVVVLDEHGGAEIVAVVVGAAGAHGVALEQAQPGRRLARVGDDGVCIPRGSASTTACEAGSSGVLVGRSVWAEAATLEPVARDGFLATTGRDRLRRLAELVDGAGRPWHARPGRLATATMPGESWYRGY